MAKGKKILIVDDEKPMARALELKLNKVGFEAKTAFNGEEAIEILGKDKFDLIITDLVMPKVDGFGVLDALKKKKDKTPVIVSSNLGQEEDLKKAKSLGAKDYFVKSDTPITKVVEHVNKILKL
jgi:DNA-binding response OmpR family regulator